MQRLHKRLRPLRARHYPSAPNCLKTLAPPAGSPLALHRGKVRKETRTDEKESPCSRGVIPLGIRFRLRFRSTPCGELHPGSEFVSGAGPAAGPAQRKENGPTGRDRPDPRARHRRRHGRRPAQRPKNGPAGRLRPYPYARHWRRYGRRSTPWASIACRKQPSECGAALTRPRFRISPTPAEAARSHILWIDGF